MLIVLILTINHGRLQQLQVMAEAGPCMDTQSYTTVKRMTELAEATI